MSAERAEPAETSRAAEVAALGLGRGTADEVDRAAREALADDATVVRTAGITAAVRAGTPAVAAASWAEAIVDAGVPVRRRAAELAPLLVERGADPAAPVAALVALLADEDPTVVEAAAYGLGELGAQAIAGAAVEALSSTATSHSDAIAREAAVAALGALGDPAGLPAVLAGCRDKVTVRRRAVLALAPFDGPEVDAALASALTDRDWQVRQAAEDLSSS